MKRVIIITSREDAEALENATHRAGFYLREKINGDLELQRIPRELVVPGSGALSAVPCA